MIMNYLTKEENIILLIDMLKANGIRRAIVSPGATNRTFVASMQYDGSFQLYSCVDERSAAYMACGMAEESGEPVVLSCTGATASRNYMPGLTEAYYRKLPIICITSSQNNAFIPHLRQQLTDRTEYPNDVFVDGVQIQPINTELDKWDCSYKIQRALLAIKRRGGGPVHINIQNSKKAKYNDSIKYLRRIGTEDIFPDLVKGTIAVYITSHRLFSEEESNAITNFCKKYNAVALCDHTSGYYGEFRIDYSLIANQLHHNYNIGNLDLLIHLGEMCGDNPALLSINSKNVWRVNPDGEIRIRFNRLDYIFEMNEITFFDHYNKLSDSSFTQFRDRCNSIYDSLFSEIPELSFSNVWVAKKLAPIMPANSVIHFGILNSLRSWNLFKLNPSIRTSCNVGGFGIDGCMSSLIGASMCNRNKIYYLILGDLAFFYDLNSLGNRHINSNIRIILINNGKGGEFKRFTYKPLPIDDDLFLAAAHHFGNRSHSLVKNFTEDLGFEYHKAETKDGFNELVPLITSPHVGEKPLFIEVFVDTQDQSDSLKAIFSIAEPSFDEQVSDYKLKAKSLLSNIIKA